MLKIQKKLHEAAKVVGKIDLPSSKEDDGKVTQPELNSLEKMLDKLFKSANIDLVFTRHFLDRVNDKRNKRQITVDELRAIFKKTYRKYADDLNMHGPDWQAILNDISNDINIPFVLVWDKKNNELDLVNKTIMRKKGFKSSNPKLKV